MAASGRAGERVAVHAAPLRAPVGPLLRARARRPRLPRVAGYRSRRWLPQPGAQTGFVGWQPAALTPSTFLADNFACDAAGAGESNVSRLCDRELDRLIDRAERTPPAEALSAWAAADRRVTAVAAAVPLTSRRVAILVSKRVGNVKTHYQWFPLLDQMWVR